MSESNRATDSRGGSGDALIWISLMVFGLAAAFAMKIARPGPVADAYVEVVPLVGVLVEKAQPRPGPEAGPGSGAGTDAAARFWVDSGDPRLAAREVVPVEGVANVVWEQRRRLDPEEARVRLAEIATLEQELAGREPTAREAEQLREFERKRVVPSRTDSIGIWIAALLTLAILSFLVRDNPAYKVAESVLIGASAAYWMVDATWSTLVPSLLGNLAPDFTRQWIMPGLPVSETPGTDFALALVPLALGIMLLWRLAPRGAWIAVWPLALVIGTFAGMRLIGHIESDLVAQVESSMRPLVVMHPRAYGANPGIDVGATILSLVGIVGVLTVLVYFFFSLEHRGLVGKTARVGIWYLMITFGAAFGLTVMGRITLLSARFEFLFKDWLGIS